MTGDVLQGQDNCWANNSITTSNTNMSCRDSGGTNCSRTGDQTDGKHGKGNFMIVETLCRQVRLALVGAGLVLTSFTTGYAQDAVAEMVLDDCAPELENFCGTVSAGRGRIAACLYAHNDQLSEQCAISLSVGLVQFRMILAAVDYVGQQCRGDLDKLCDGVKIGGGQVYQCLTDNKDKLNESCSAAFTQIQEDLQ